MRAEEIYAPGRARNMGRPLSEVFLEYICDLVNDFHFLLFALYDSLKIFEGNQ
jgi:hypothetical protein